MADTKSINILQGLHPGVRDRALAAYYEAVKATPVGVHPFITEGYRSFERSDELYKLGRTVVNPDGKSKSKPMGNIVSFAKAGQSYHNYFLAFDFVLLVNGKMDWTVNHNWMVVVNIFKAHGFKSGLDFSKKKRDPPHLEMSFGYSVGQLLAKYKAKQFIPNTNFLQL